jgi:glycosyltransferase involved in cell wall biosynthesis
LGREIDVVIPVRDVVQYLEEAIQSALAQTMPCKRIVVVDAGSLVPVEIKNKSEQIPIELIRSEDPLTTGAARNLGIKHLAAEFISFLDADDIWPPNRNEILMNALELKGARVVYGAVRNFVSVAKTKQFAPEVKLGSLAGSTIFERSLVDELAAFDESLVLGEYVDWFTRVIQSGATIANSEREVLWRRVHPDSTTAKALAQQSRDDYVKVVRNWMSKRGS